MLILDQLKRSDRGLWLMAVGILAAFGGLLVWLAYLQVFSVSRYQASQQAQSIRRIRFPAVRGTVHDRRGQSLAENRPMFNANLYIEELSPLFKAEYRRLIHERTGTNIARRSWWDWLGRRPAQKPAPAPRLTAAEREALGRQARFQVVNRVVQELAAQIEQPLALDEARFHQHYEELRALPLPLLENLSDSIVARMQERPERPVGVNLDVQPMRWYPHGMLAAHLLGQVRRLDHFQEEIDDGFYYCLPDYQGNVGIEGAFDRELRGQAGFKAVRVNNMGYRQSETIWSPAQPGRDVHLTIDLRIQRAAEQALRQAGAAPKGAVVVMDPRNGDLLAMASSPAFDPNSFVPRMSHANWVRLSDPDLNPMLNRASFGSYAPGSIFKIVVALAGLEAGTLDPREIYSSKGYYSMGRRSRPIGDTAPAGDYDFRRAFKLSSNSYFIHQGLRAGLDRIIEMGQRFFLGQRTQIPLLQEVRGFFPTLEWVSSRNEQGDPVQPGEVANLCIGQGFLTVTPLQMAVLTCAIANGGTVYWPRLVEPVELGGSASAGGLRSAGRPRGQLGVSQQHLALVREGMLADVEDPDGTGRHASVIGMRVCGKTGTAEVALNGGGKRLDTWFVSFAPFEKPRYAVVVVVEGGASGGGTCAPVARSIYQALRQLEIQANSSKPERSN
ncbi:MAG TPA: penicillin-binding transpeptidase domain-containing protein [Candidatus Paceibacterota bacterium]|nr:penicillin-binding transpeptidase domain-containing protein [Verrucomicrobiota bacterium]HRZ47172.1 penicillin-binding transpeptidase domain-containing protein [Candidatus Paceibacterota bacterium]HRZ93042.1 penicillin-binding transpeptidase domain-containing protein [Candidatus Paceibacterota bacterium]